MRTNKSITAFGSFAALMSLFILSCDSKNTASTQKVDSLKSQPKVEIKVNRKYDDKGNLIMFDSLYTSFYSNIKKDSIFADSLFRAFDETFNRNHSTLLDRRFRTLFFTDTLPAPDFFNHDFFLRRYELNDPYLRKMMHDMDSIKNRFYEEESRVLRGKENKK